MGRAPLLSEAAPPTAGLELRFDLPGVSLSRLALPRSEVGRETEGNQGSGL